MYEWIPCKKRQPAEIGNYLITTSKGNTWVARWDVLGWCGRYKNVQAWMPLPEPYERRTDETIHCRK